MDGGGNGATGAPGGHEVAPLEVLMVPGMTATGCQLAEDMPLDQWRRFIRSVGRFGRAVPWVLGDALAFGERVYGESYAAYADETGYDVQTLQIFVYVAHKFAPDRRRDGPHQSWSHHLEVASLPTAGEQDEWLDRALNEGWSKSALRTNLRAAKGITEEPASTLDHALERLQAAVVAVAATWPEGDAAWDALGHRLCEMGQRALNERRVVAAPAM